MTKYILTLSIALIASIPGTSYAEDKFLDIQEVKSKSGITAWLVEDHSIPVIAMQFAFKGTGSKNDPLDKQGLARLASNTMDEGAGDLDSETFQKTLLNQSITLHFSSTRDHFSGQIKTLSRNKAEAFNLLELALSQPRFDDDAVERMKLANKSRVHASIPNPRWIAARIQNDVLFEGHPYAHNSGGTLSGLDAITREDLHGFHQTLGKNQLIIGVAGDIDAEELVQYLDEVFGDMPDAQSPTPVEFDLKNAGRTYVYEKPVPQSIVEIAQNGVRRGDEDFYAAYIMNFILGESGFGSRLMEEVREKRGLTYGIYSYFREYDETDTLQISTSTANETVNEVLTVINGQLEDIKENMVSEDELTSAKSYLIGSLPLSLTSTDAIASVLLSLQLDALPIDYLDQRAALLNAVTAEDVQKTAQRILDTNALTTVIVGQPENISDATLITELPNVK
ncbi:MAG: M16 family metallopeptidase [Alphaproteobacteria bacterium]